MLDQGGGEFGEEFAGGDGPNYNCGCAWDRSVFLFVEVNGDDTYELSRSPGLGVGDIGSWGVFADLAGNDRYRSTSVPGRTSRDGLAVFYDKSGQDQYTGFLGTFQMHQATELLSVMG